MRVLMLHDVRPFDDSFFPERYKQHSFLTDSEFLNGLNKIKDIVIDPYLFLKNIKKDLKKVANTNKVILTFDDGLKDHLWVAKVLSEENIKAIFFIPFGIINSNNFIHSHLIQFLNASGKKDIIAKYIEEYLEKKVNIPTSQISQYKLSKWKKNVWSEEEIFITRTLREIFNYESRDEILNHLIKEYITVDLKEVHNKFYLTFDDIQAIREMGHTIGSHGYFSLDLRYEDDSTVKNELEKSYESLKKYNHNLNTISYPNGGFSEKIKKVVNKIGFEFAFGTEHRDIKLNDDLLFLPRLDGTKLSLFT